MDERLVLDPGDWAHGRRSKLVGYATDGMRWEETTRSGQCLICLAPITSGMRSRNGAMVCFRHVDLVAAEKKNRRNAS